MATAPDTTRTISCEETARLLRVYSFATLDYSRAVKVLHERSGTMSRQTYEEIRVFADKARDLTEQARAELDRHLAEHRCF